MPRIVRYKFDGQAQRAYNAWMRDKPEEISVDCETTGFTWTDRPFGVTFAWRGEQHYIETGDFVRECMIANILMSTPVLIMHNAKFDMRMLIQSDLLVRDRLYNTCFHDTETLAHLLDENRPKGLKHLVQVVLGRSTDEAEVLKVVRRKLKLKKDDGYHLLPREVLIPYAITDARFTYDLYQVFKQQMAEKPEQLQEKYLEELKLTLVLLDMEAAGMAIRPEYVSATVKEYGLKVLQTEKQIIDLVGIEDFNPNSPAQVIKAFAARGIHLTSTAKDVLAEIDDPLVDLLKDLRNYSKTRSTYLVPILEEAVDGVLHPNLRQHGTATGRLSSGEAGED